MIKAATINHRKWLKIGIFLLLFGILFFGLIKFSHAQGSTIGEEWDKYIGGVSTFAPNELTGEELAINFVLRLVRITRNLVGGLALILGLVYGVRLVTARGEEDVITKQRTNFLWMFVGFVILIISEQVATIFNPENATATALIDFEAGRDQLRNIVDYIKWLLGSAIVLYMAIVAFRMIATGDDEEEIKKQKTSLTWSLLGMLIILLADNIVRAVYVLNGPDDTAAATASTGIGEITSVIRLILVFMGPIAVIFGIYAGFLYLTALDNEEQANKAKRMIITGVVAIVIIYGAFALVNTITSEDLAQVIPHLELAYLAA